MGDGGDGRARSPTSVWDGMGGVGWAGMGMRSSVGCGDVDDEYVYVSRKGLSLDQSALDC